MSWRGAHLAVGWRATARLGQCGGQRDDHGGGHPFEAWVSSPGAPSASSSGQGEEQGLLGSMAWVDAHLAKRALRRRCRTRGAAQTQRYRTRFPIAPQPGNATISRPTFQHRQRTGRGCAASMRRAMSPHVPSSRNGWRPSPAWARPMWWRCALTGSTDHVYMQAIGAPGFQFIQDPLDYGELRPPLQHRHLRSSEARRICARGGGAAGMLFQSANSAKTLPRKPLPTQPAATDPFKYEDPAGN